MKLKSLLVLIVTVFTFFNSQAQGNASDETDQELLGLPGDNLNLYATLDLFQKSKTIEEFEAALNKEETGINNLDLNLDGKVGFRIVSEIGVLRILNMIWSCCTPIN